MKTFEVRVIQPIIAYYYGWLNIEALDKDDAIRRLSEMSPDEIGNKVEWIMDENTEETEGEIEIEMDTLTEI